VDKKEVEKMSKNIKRHYNRNSASAYSRKNDTSKDMGDSNHLKIFRKDLNTVTGKQFIKELQKTAILGIAHILRKVLM
jgi:glyceraldehyde-3-phosphate dehydrogenase/erythrose-4-phosphate dehydrogenase